MIRFKIKDRTIYFTDEDIKSFNLEGWDLKKSENGTYVDKYNPLDVTPIRNYYEKANLRGVIVSTNGFVIDYKSGVPVTKCANYERDNVDNPVEPLHYKNAKIEAIDCIEAITFGKEGIETVCVGNIVKYLHRYPMKKGLEDVKKCRWYLEKLIKHLESSNEKTN